VVCKNISYSDENDGMINILQWPKIAVEEKGVQIFN
jgi:hypothetical protein